MNACGDYDGDIADDQGYGVLTRIRNGESANKVGTPRQQRQ
jgi:hypothetical protein